MSVPTATFMFKTNSKATRAIPAIKAANRITTSNANQYSYIGQDTHSELPRDRL